MFNFKLFVVFLVAGFGIVDGVVASDSALSRFEYVSIDRSENAASVNDETTFETFFEVPDISPEHLGPVLLTPPVLEHLMLPSYRPNTSEANTTSIFDDVKPWQPSIVPILEKPILPTVPQSDIDGSKSEVPKSEVPKQDEQVLSPLVEDAPLKMPRIAILIDDLGYNRHGMESSLELPTEVALAILPSTPFAKQTALVAQKQKRITLLHAPMENQRELKLGPGGLYAKMTELELKETLMDDINDLPGIQGVNNHMGSLLTTKELPMQWVMETLKLRSLFFIDSLTSPKSVAKKTAQKFGLRTVSRDVFLDNIRTEQAIDKQFSRLIKLARQRGSALAIGHPYPETTAYLKKRLKNIEADGVRLVPLSDLLISPQP